MNRGQNMSKGRPSKEDGPSRQTNTEFKLNTANAFLSRCSGSCGCAMWCQRNKLQRPILPAEYVGPFESAMAQKGKIYVK